MSIKQVIVMRSDLKMRRGKECAQAAHASMAWLTNRFRAIDAAEGNLPSHAEIPLPWCYEVALSPQEREWVNGIFTKVCVRVDSEEELIAVYEKAKAAGILAELITDSGLTEFNHVPTRTCCAIGPAEAETLAPITGHLKLY